MADLVTTRWIYPPNFAGFPSGMKGVDGYSVHLTCLSDGTGEVDVAKVNISELLDSNGLVPTRTVIESIHYLIHGMTVRLQWDRAPDQTIAFLNCGLLAVSVSGIIDFTKQGTVAGLVDPGGEGTGDIILSSTACDSGDSYDITINFKVK